jgi:hypothetical protein
MKESFEKEVRTALVRALLDLDSSSCPDGFQLVAEAWGSSILSLNLSSHL